MIYYETIASSDCEQFELTKMGDSLWFEIIEGEWSADNIDWLFELQDDLAEGRLDTDHVRELKQGLLDSSIEPNTETLLIISSILTEAKWRGWFDNVG